MIRALIKLIWGFVWWAAGLFVIYYVITTYGDQILELNDDSSQEEEAIKESARIFIESLFENDYYKGKPYIYFGDGLTDESVQGMYTLYQTGFQIHSSLSKGFTGITPNFQYRIEDIQFVDPEHVRLTYMIKSDISNEEYIQSTFIKEDNVWKIHITSFFTGTM
ncbi:hypothetical protein [Lysinibacillus antri]|uniref:DUF4878 domain-containing protein n=1 Tax=Lysinibacillus antri TaxID=2498145 RepID=A0A432L6T7_9BACI|nr:hypothetical protein [Lysinibacillus antri]RUL45641.1 hypothetical protein EK386_19495 [Lysinibacillus antri]